MTVMYLGPDLKGIVRHNQIFAYHPEEVIGRACEVCGLARHLFVPMENIVPQKKELARQGSFLNLSYQKIKKAEKNRR
ncbi:MAG: hypothetical protein NC417_09005 [Candidatus Gastranaerophilales bacterium]|nr:hypothetical protein [Candidatus Gastranaerophilales bacterium]